MKKIYSIILVAASLAVAACQPTELDNITPIDKSGNSIKITATIDGIDSETKVTYAPEGKGLKPSWTKIDDPKYADKILVFTSNDKKALYAVSEISKKGVATFSHESGDEITGLTTGTKVYGIYYPGKGTGDIVDGELAVDISNQNGSLGDDTPAIMCATATVGSDGSVNFTFENQTAIVGINKIQVGSGSEGSLGTSQKLTKVILSGVITSGTISVGSNGKLQLTGNSTFSEIEATPTSIIEWETSDKGMIDFSGSGNLPLSFAVIPSSQQEEPYITAVFTKDETDYTFTNSKAIDKVSFAAGRYYYMSKKLDCQGEAVAKVNDKRYATIDAAFEAADGSSVACTITLLDNCSTSSTLYIQNSDKGGAVTLDLNGKTLSCESNSFIYVGNNRSFTITDSSSEDVAKHGTIQIVGAMYVLQGNGTSTLTITGGKLSSPDRGIYVGSGANLTISDGEIESKNQCVYNYGNTSIEGGSFASTNEDATSSTEVVASVNNGAIVTVTGGYFSAASNNYELFVLRGTSGSKCCVSGGFFDRPINSNRTKSSDGNNNYTNTLNSNETSKANYPYIVSNYKLLYINTVGNTNYNHASLPSAARHAKYALSDVLITVANSPSNNQANVDLSNSSNNAITLDLNGCTLKTETSSFITSTGTALLTIKDSKSGSEKGKITSSDKNIISLTTAGANITLDGCIIESTANASTTNADAAIYIHPSALPRAQIRICDDAQVYTENGVTTIYSYLADISLDDCEITSGTLGSGRYVIFASTGSKIEVNKGASLYSYNASNDFSAIHCGTANSASITINGGYMYGKSALTAGSSNYCQTFQIYGGYFNTDVSKISGYSSHKIYGSINTCTESHTPQPTNVELNYGFKCETAAAKIGTTAYTSLEDAITAANSSSSNVTITLLKSLTHDASITLNNNNSKEITLDLNGYTLTAGVESFIKGTKYVVTDNKGGGKIISDYNNIIYLVGSNSATLRNCELYSTVEKGENNSTNRAVYGGSTSSALTIDGAIITATKTTAVYSMGSVTINSTSKVTAALYALYATGTSTKGAAFVIKGGSFRSTGTNCTYIGNTNASIEIEHGYFSTGGASSAVLYGGNSDCRGKYTIQGGYYSKALNSEIPDYGQVVQLSSPDTIDGITYTHAHTSEINP